MCSARHAENKKQSDKLSWEQTLSLDTTDTCIVYKQTNGDCATTKTDLMEGRKTNKEPATRQQAGRNNLVSAGRQKNLITPLDLCVSSQHSPNTVTRLSHNSIGHGVVGVNMVVTGCSSQQLI